MSAGAPRLEVREELFLADLGEQGVHVPYFTDTGVGDNGEYELCRLLFRRFESSAVGALYLVGRL